MGVVNGVTSVYVGDHYEVETHGAVQTTRLYYSASGQRVAVRANGTLTFLLTDHLGSTSLAVTANGALAGEQRYTAFGQTRYAMGDLPTTYEYTGQRNEELLGLYFYRARWYDAAIGRFVQPDTLIPGAGLPSSFDRYAYVHNNPLRYTDPGGHWLETALDIAGIVYDIHDISSNGLNWVNGISLVVDVAFTIVPVATGGGLIVRALAHADDAVDAARAVSAAVNTAQAANQAANAAQAANRGSDAVRSADRLGDLAQAGWRAQDASASSARGLLDTLRREGEVVVPRGGISARTMGEISAEAGAEVGLFRMASGERRLMLGEARSVRVPQEVRRIVAHTHPSGILRFSAADMAALASRGQRSSVIVDLFGNARRLRVPH